MQDEKQMMLAELRKLYYELGEVPNRYDWVIHTDLEWWKYFKYWGNFVTESGIIGSGGNIKYKRGPSKITEEKLCETLRVVEERLGRPATPKDWHLLVDHKSDSNHPKGQRYFWYFGMVGTKGRKKTDRWDLEKYVENYEDLAYAGFYNDHLGWINFRYAAGLDNYTREDLIDLGINLIKPLMISSEIDGDDNLIKPLMISSEIGGDDYLIDFVKRRMNLPHLAVYDYFGTFENYLKELDGHCSSEEEPLKEYYNASLEELNSKGEESIEELLSSMKELADKLSRKGLKVEIRIVL